MNKTPCPKCGFEKLGIRYDVSSDKLIRTCYQCGYSRRENPLDAIPSDFFAQLQALRSKGNSY